MGIEFLIVSEYKRSFELSRRFRTGVIYFVCFWGQLVTVRLEITYSRYRVCTDSVLVEVRVECQSVSGCHRLIIGSVFLG